MHEELKKLIAESTKNKRDLKELQALKAKMLTHKEPDQKMLSLINNDMVELERKLK